MRWVVGRWRPAALVVVALLLLSGGRGAGGSSRSRSKEASEEAAHPPPVSLLDLTPLATRHECAVTSANWSMVFEEAAKDHATAKYHDTGWGLGHYRAINSDQCRPVGSSLAPQCFMTEEEMFKIRLLLAKCLMAVGVVERSIQVLHTASVYRVPDQPHKRDLHYHLGRASLYQGRLSQAAVHFKAALSFCPTDLPSHHRLASILLAQNDIPNGLHYYWRALDLYRSHANQLLHNLSLNLTQPPKLPPPADVPGPSSSLWVVQHALAWLDADWGDDEDSSLKPVKSKRRPVLTIKTHTMLSSALHSLHGDLDASARFHLGWGLHKRGFLKEGDEHLTTAAAPWNPHGPLYGVRAALAMPLLHDSRRALALSLQALEASLERYLLSSYHLPEEVFTQDPPHLIWLVDWLPCLALAAPYLQEDELLDSVHYIDPQHRRPPLMALIHQLFLDISTSTDLPQLPPPGAPPLNAQASRQTPIKVAFISARFRQHPVAKMVVGLMAALPRPQFHVVAVSFPSPVDGWTRKVLNVTDATLSLTPHDLYESAHRLSHTLQPDIIIYPDLPLDPLTYALALLRLAPAQLTLWGHTPSPGLPSIDYVVTPTSMMTHLGTPTSAAATDSLITPLSYQATSPEQPLMLDGLPPYDPPPPLPPPDREDLLARYLLPPDHTIYLLPCPIYALHPDFDDAILSLLQADPVNATLVIVPEGSLPDRLNALDPAFVHDPLQYTSPSVWMTRLTSRLRAKLGNRLFSRLRFITPQPPRALISLMAISHVILDPYPPTTPTPFFTAIDALLAASTPVITALPAQRPGLRMVPAALQVLLTDPSCCLAMSGEEYISKAVALAHDRDGMRGRFHEALVGARGRWEEAGRRHVEEWAQVMARWMAMR